MKGRSSLVVVVCDIIQYCLQYSSTSIGLYRTTELYYNIYRNTTGSSSLSKMDHSTALYYSIYCIRSLQHVRGCRTKDCVHHVCQKQGSLVKLSTALCCVLYCTTADVGSTQKRNTTIQSYSTIQLPSNRDRVL